MKGKGRLFYYSILLQLLATQLRTVINQSNLSLHTSRRW